LKVHETLFPLKWKIGRVGKKRVMDFKLADKIWNAFSLSVSFSHFYSLSFLLTLFLTFNFILTLSSLLIYLSLFLTHSLSYSLSFLLTLFLTFNFILTLSSLLISLSLFITFSLSLSLYLSLFISFSLSSSLSLISVFVLSLSLSNFFPFCHLSIFLLNFFISWRFRSDSSHFPSVSFFIFSNFNYFKRMSDGEINLFFPKFPKLVISCFNFVHYYTYILFVFCRTFLSTIFLI